MKHLNFISSVRTFVTRIVQDLFPQSRAERTSMVQSPLDLGISYFKAWNNQNLAGIIASFTKGGTYSDPVVGKRISRKATAEYAKILWEGFHELKFEVTQLTTNFPEKPTDPKPEGVTVTYLKEKIDTEQTQVIVSWKMSGRNSKWAGGCPPTDRSVNIQGYTVLALDREKISSAGSTFFAQADVLQVAVYGKILASNASFLRHFECWSRWLKWLVAPVLIVFLHPYVTCKPLTFTPVLGLLAGIVFGLLWMRLWLRTAREWGSSQLLANLALYLPCITLIVFFPAVLTFIKVLPEGKIYRALLEGLVLSVEILVGWLLCSQITDCLLLIIRDRQLYRQPEAYLRLALYEALAFGTFSKNEVWTSPSKCKAILYQLENAARCLEFIPRQIAARDRESSLWCKLAYQQRATAIRELKKWIVLPKIDTPDKFSEKLRGIVKLVYDNDWDALPVAESGKALPWWKTVLSLTRSLTSALVPPMVVWLLYWQHHLAQEYSTYLLTVASLWGVVSLLAILDPGFAERVSALKDVKEVVSSLKPGDKES